MDQALSTVIIALITGIFSVITLVIQKRQDKVISKIDQQTTFIEKEKTLKQKLAQKEKEREMIIHEIMILVLDTNLDILKNSQPGDVLDESVFKVSDDLKTRFNKTSDEIKELSKEYEMLLEVASQLQEELEMSQKGKN